jgi:hypothetical protein
MNTRLSTDLLDAIDGATESRGRDSQITEWADRAQRLERALERLTDGWKYPAEVTAIAREALGVTQGEAVRAREPVVKCRCGWRGKAGELVHMSALEQDVCPACKAEFKPVGNTNWYPLRVVRTSRFPDGVAPDKRETVRDVPVPKCDFCGQPPAAHKPPRYLCPPIQEARRRIHEYMALDVRNGQLTIDQLEQGYCWPLNPPPEKSSGGTP